MVSHLVVLCIAAVVTASAALDVDVWDRCDDWNATLVVRLPTGLCDAAGARLEVVGDVSRQAAPLQYRWSTGERTDAINVLTPGAYGVTVTDAHQCVLERVVEVPVFDVFAVTVTAHGTTCHGGRDGHVGALVRGRQPIRYQWSNGRTVEEQDVRAGNYSVTVTDANNCTASHTMTVMEPPPIYVELDVIDTNCVEAHTGSITARVIGGNRPYNRLGTNRTHEEAVWKMALRKHSNALQYENLRYFNNAPRDFTVTVESATDHQSVRGLVASSLPVGHYRVNITDITGCARRRPV